MARSVLAATQDWGMKPAQLAGEVCTRRKNRLTDANLETGVMIKKNKHYLGKLRMCMYDLCVLITILVSTIYY